MHKVKRRYKTAAAFVAAMGLAVAVYGFASILSLHGALDLSDYQGFFQSDYPDYTGPAVVEFTAFTMKPGDAFPWHYHEGLAYAVLVKGTITEDEGCGNVRKFSAGAGFVEIPGGVHRVINEGPGAAIIYAALMYPEGAPDIVVQDGPSCSP
jgi:quercetin dioxygenase-like cupin family protein